MSSKKKKAKKKNAAEKIIAKEGSKRKLIPFAAGRLPSISKSMPQVANAAPLVGREIPLVSKPVPLISAIPNITLPRYWGIMPSRKWGASKIPTSRKRGVKRPKDMGLLRALGETIVSPVMGPMKLVKGIASRFKEQAEEEREPRVALEQELLELKMRREMNEISEEAYEMEETKLKKRMKNIERRRR